MFNEVFWLSVSFILFIVLVYKPTKKYVLDLLDDKIGSIARNLKEAEELYEKAQDKLEKLHSEHDSILGSKKEIIQKAQDDAINIIKDAEAKSRELIKQFDHIAKQRIEALKGEFIKETKRTILSEALENVKNDLNKKYTAKDNDNLITQKFMHLDSIVAK